MKQNTKDWIQYGSAVMLIISGIVIAFISLIITMTIGAGVLAYIGEALSSALAIFGIGVYVTNKLAQFENDARNEIDKIKREVNDDKTC
jgi:hypothetical protein